MWQCTVAARRRGTASLALACNGSVTLSSSRAAARQKNRTFECVDAYSILTVQMDLEQESYADLNADSIRGMSVKQLQKLMSDNGVSFNRRDKKATMIALALDFFQLDDETDDEGDHADAELRQVHVAMSSGSAEGAVAAVEALSAAGLAVSDEDAWCVADIDAEIASIQKMHFK